MISISIAQKSHKADLAILHFNKNVFDGIIRIKNLY